MDITTSHPHPQAVQVLPAVGSREADEKCRAERTPRWLQRRSLDPQVDGVLFQCPYTPGNDHGSGK